MGLPMTLAEMKKRGWNELDFVFISGDAYVDHPSFSTALIARWLEHLGYRVGIVAQPDWLDEASIQILGKPRLGVLVNAGNLDSMLCHYTAAKNRRKADKYTPDGVLGKRPDRAVKVYSQLAKKVWPDLPVIVGGVEASLRRFAHYDYWDDKVLPSVLVESGADLLIYGMGERAVESIADQLKAGVPLDQIRYVPGTCFISDNLDEVEDYIELAPYEVVSKNKKAFSTAFKLQYWEQDPIQGKTIVQPHEGRFLVQLPPALPLEQSEMDTLYSLPFTRMPHPSYGGANIPALEEVLFSITSHRGCFGSCAFCAITSHQGRMIQNRSQDSIVAEAKLITQHRDFKGYIHDVGGPSANFRQVACEDQKSRGACRGRQCIGVDPCEELEVDHSEYMELLRRVRALPKVKKVFIRSGIRYDYLMQDPRHYSVLKEIIEHHVSGQLKVAPEHVSPQVLKYMGKPKKEVYLKFKALYEKLNKEMDKKQFLVPYFISSHPGATLEDAVALSEFLRDHQHWPEQVQDFIPTPGSLATAMYWSGLDPLTGEEIFVARTGIEKIQQRVLLQPKLPQNRKWVLESLRKAGREDLIGTGPKCLVADFYNGKKKEEEALPEFTRKPRKFATKSKKGSRGKSSFSKKAGSFSKPEERTEIGSKPFAKDKPSFGKKEGSFSPSGESAGRGVNSSSRSTGFKGKRTEKSESSWTGESGSFSDKPRGKSGFGKKEGSFSPSGESAGRGVNSSSRSTGFKGKRTEKSESSWAGESGSFSDKPRGKSGFGKKEGSFSPSGESAGRGMNSSSRSTGFKGKRTEKSESSWTGESGSFSDKPRSKSGFGKKEGSFSPSGESAGRGMNSSSNGGGFKGKRTEKSESSWAGESGSFSDKPRSKSGFGKKEGTFSPSGESTGRGVNSSSRSAGFKGKRTEKSESSWAGESGSFSDKPRSKSGFGKKEGTFSPSGESATRGPKSGTTGGYKGTKTEQVGAERGSKPTSRDGKPKSGTPTKASWGKKEGNFSGGFTAKGPKNNRKR